MTDEYYCPFIYKSLECNYKGDLPSCDKTLEHCKKHDNIERFPCNPFQKLINKANK